MKQNSRWYDIFMHLKECGYDVYSPGNKEGECKKPYIVVKDAGSSKTPSMSSSIALFDILLYMPRNQYSRLEPFVKGVEEVMDGLWPMIRPAHFRTTAFYDDSVKAWMVSIQYKNYQKNKRP